jgi:DNA-binding transcriptional ArsR family regulator
MYHGLVMNREAMLEVGRALSCETRLSLLTALARDGATVTELVRQTGASQPNVSNHLALLRAAGLVTGERNGRTARYELASSEVRNLVQALLAFSGSAEQASPVRAGSEG